MGHTWVTGVRDDVGAVWRRGRAAWHDGGHQRERGEVKGLGKAGADDALIDPHGDRAGSRRTVQEGSVQEKRGTGPPETHWGCNLRAGEH